MVSIHANIPGQRLDNGQFVDEGAPVGPREKSGLIPIPYSRCNDPNYMLLAVGRAYHGVLLANA